MLHSGGSVSMKQCTYELQVKGGICQLITHCITSKLLCLSLTCPVEVLQSEYPILSRFLMTNLRSHVTDSPTVQCKMSANHI